MSYYVPTDSHASIFEPDDDCSRVLLLEIARTANTCSVRVAWGAALGECGVEGGEGANRGGRLTSRKRSAAKSAPRPNRRTHKTPPRWMEILLRSQLPAYPLPRYFHGIILIIIIMIAVCRDCTFRDNAFPVRRANLPTAVFPPTHSQRQRSVGKSGTPQPVYIRTYYTHWSVCRPYSSGRCVHVVSFSHAHAPHTAQY